MEANSVGEDQMVCDVCGDDTTRHLAQFRCLDCGENMCSEIQRAHSLLRVSQDHEVVPLDASNKERTRTARLLCPQHQEPFKFYDTDCSQLTCRDCQVLSHNGHSCKSLQHASVEAHSQVQSLVDSTAAVARDMEIALHRVACVKKELLANLETKNVVCRDFFDEVRAAVDARERIVLTELKKQCDEKEASLEEQYEKIQNCNSAAQDRLQRAEEIQPPSESTSAIVAIETIQLRNELEEELKNIDTITEGSSRLAPVVDSRIDLVVGIDEAITYVSELVQVNNQAGGSDQVSKPQGDLDLGFESTLPKPAPNKSLKFYSIPLVGSPVEQQHFNKVQPIGVAIGDSHSIVWDKNNDVYAFGQGAQGQLGLGIFETQCQKFEKLESLKGQRFIVRDIKCGSNHTVLLTTTGSVYAWGLNDNGQLGIQSSASSCFKPQLVSISHNSRFVGVACGSNFSVLWSEQGEVFTCGANDHKQLGGPRSQHQGAKPTQAVTPQDNTFQHHLSFASNTIVSNVCGANDHQQLGGRRSQHQGAKPTQAVTPQDNTFQHRLSFASNTIVSIVCGASHAVAIIKGEGLYVWGSNQFGQINPLQVGNSLALTRLEWSADIDVAFVDCGAQSTMILDRNNRVYWTGVQSQQYNGHRGQPDRKVLQFPSDVKSVACLESLATAWSPTQGLFRFHSGSVGQATVTTRNCISGHRFQNQEVPFPVSGIVKGFVRSFGSNALVCVECESV